VEQAVEKVAQLARIAFPGQRQGDPVAGTLEELRVEVALQGLDLVTDRGWRQAKLVRRILYRHVPRRRLEGPDGGEGGKLASHVRSMN